MIEESELKEIENYARGFYNPFAGCCCGSDLITVHECKLRSGLAETVLKLVEEIRSNNLNVVSFAQPLDTEKLSRLSHRLNLLGVPLEDVCLEWGMFDERGRQDFQGDIVEAIKIGESDLVKHYLHNSGTQFCGATFRYIKGQFTVMSDGSLLLGNHEHDDVAGILGLALEQISDD